MSIEVGLAPGRRESNYSILSSDHGSLKRPDNSPKDYTSLLPMTPVGARLNLEISSLIKPALHVAALS